MGQSSIRRSQPFRILLEAVLIAGAGVVFAFAANSLSPKGLSLNRDYFHSAADAPTDRAVTSTQQSQPATNTASAGTNVVVTPEDSVVLRLKEKGLLVVERAEVEQLFQDPRYEQEHILFVDARNDADYQAGHIPGAYQLDHYYPERYLAEVLPASQLAEIVVVYCTGGSCEDSEFAALMLRDAGVPADHLRVYVGGIHDWTKGGLPLESGTRRSGTLLPNPASP